MAAKDGFFWVFALPQVRLSDCSCPAADSQCWASGGRSTIERGSGGGWSGEKWALDRLPQHALSWC